MSEGFTYEAALHDSMSAPAHHAEAALGSLEHELGGLDRKLLETFAAGNLLAKGLEEGASLAREAAEAFFDFGKEGITFALEAAEFKENMSLAFSVVAGTAREGEETYKGIERIAVASHVNVAQAGALAKDLALSGVENVKTLESTVAAVGALQRVGLEGAAAKLPRIIEQSEALGHFALPKKLGAGFSVDAIVGELARSLHKAPEVIRAELKAGKIETDAGIAAIVNSINSGKVGQLARQKFDLADVVTDWRNVWQELTESIDSGPLTEALRSFVGIFSDGTPSAKAFKDEVVTDLNTVIKWLGDGVYHVEILALEMELGFLKGQNAALPLIITLHQAGFVTPSWEALGGAVQTTAKYLTEAAYAALTLGAALSHLQGWLGTEGARALHAGGFQSAEGFVAGIVEGLASGSGLVQGAVTTLGQGAVHALRAAWDSHSPSLVAFEIGAGVGEGMALGAESSADRSAKAVGAALAPPDFSRGNVGGGTSRSVDVGGIHIEVHASPGADGEALAVLVEERIADAIERINLELGG